MADATLDGQLVSQRRVDTTRAASRSHHVFFHELYRRFLPELCSYLSKNFGGGPPEPEDVAQAAFASFLALDNPSSVRNPRAFLYRTAHNIAITHYRKAATHRKLLEETIATDPKQTLDDLHGERVLLSRERYRLLLAAVRALRESERELLIMNRIHGLSYAEIARRVGLSQTEVKRRVARAVVACQEALDRSFSSGSSRGAAER